MLTSLTKVVNYFKTPLNRRNPFVKLVLFCIFILFALVSFSYLQELPVQAQTRTFCGIYRGTVAGANDPRLLGRVQVNVPTVFGSGHTSWAMPNVPRGKLLLPKVNDQVWISFEACDPDYPVWGGLLNVKCTPNANTALPAKCTAGV